jgi:hypothetical protein
MELDVFWNFKVRFIGSNKRQWYARENCKWLSKQWGSEKVLPIHVSILKIRKISWSNGYIEWMTVYFLDTNK